MGTRRPGVVRTLVLCAFASALAHAADPPAAPDPLRSQAEALLEEGKKLADEGRDADAELRFAAACALLRASDGAYAPATIDCTIDLYALASRLGDSERAITGMTRLAEGAAAANGADHAQTLQARSELANCYWQAGQYEPSIAINREVLARRTAVLGEKHLKTLDSVAQLAQALGDGGHPAEALPLNHRALDGTIELVGAKHSDAIISRMNLAINLHQLGRVAESAAQNERAYLDAREVLGETHWMTTLALANFAISLEELGRWEDALPMKRHAYETMVRTRGPTHPRTIRAMNNLAASYRGNGDIDTAIQWYVKALEAGRTTRGLNHPEQIYDEAALAITLIDSDRLAEADAALASLLPRAKSVMPPEHATVLRIEQAAALARWKLRGPSDARADFVAVTTKLEALTGFDDPGTIKSYAKLGELELGEGDLGAAAAALRRARDGAEALRESLATTREAQIAALAASIPAYRRLAAVEHRLGDDAASFDVAELSKGRTLLDALVTRRADESGLLPPGDADRIAELQSNLAEYDRALATGPTPERRGELEAKRLERGRALVELRRELSARYPRYAQLLGIALVKADAGRSALPADAAFVSYLFAHDRLYAYVLMRERPLEVIDLGPAAGLADAVDAYRQAIGTTQPLPLWRKGDGAYAHGIARPEDAAVRITVDELGRHLASRLLAPIEPRLSPKRQWIVSPDESLAALPFDALPWRGARVVDRHVLRYAQSLSVYALLEERHRALDRRVGRLPLLAIGAARYATSASEPSTAGTPLRKGAWSDLPASEREVDGVAALDTRTVVRKGALASEAELQRLDRSGELATFRRILFSTHAYLSPGDPRLSALVLDQVQRPAGVDGYVTVAELPGYTLASDLVVLSACETGLGRVVRGEGIMGLPYALYLAGNADAIVSLWPVLDGSTAEFMKRFFAKLRAGATHADALAAVKREFLRDPARRDPLAWAPFVLYGTR